MKSKFEESSELRNFNIFVLNDSCRTGNMACHKYRLPPSEQEILKNDAFFCQLKEIPYAGLQMLDVSNRKIPRFSKNQSQSKLSDQFIPPLCVERLKEVCLLEPTWSCSNEDDENLRHGLLDWAVQIPEKLLNAEVFVKFLDGNSAAFAISHPSIVQHLYANCGSDFLHPNFQMWSHHPPRTLVRPVHGSVYFISTAVSDLSPSMCKGGSLLKWKQS